MPLQAKSGIRIYVMARAYILEPDYRISIDLYSQPTQQGKGSLGEVVGSDWIGMRQRDVGQGQAWLYPEDHTLVLWECFLEDWFRMKDPRSDEKLRAIWLGFEGFLLRHVRPVKRIVTPSWEPLYSQDKHAWPEFLVTAGYVGIDNRAFGKEIS